jgi:hypothetical protein
VDGYNLSYLRPEATAGALTTDEYAAPLVAFWQRGIGRVAAVSFPLGGEFSGAARGWAGYGDFVQTLTRWLMGDELPPGVGLKTRLDGTLLEVDLLYDESWEERMARRPPVLHLAGDGTLGTTSHPWARLEPGHYRTSATLESKETVRGAIGLGSSALAFGPVTAGLDAEWEFDPARVDELRQLAEVSGGEERIDLSTVWSAPRRSSFLDLRPHLAVALLLALLADALVTRMGWVPPRLRRPRWRPREVTRPRRASAVRAPAPPRPQGPLGPPASPPPVPEPPADQAKRRRSRYSRAKRWGE